MFYAYIRSAYHVTAVPFQTVAYDQHLLRIALILMSRALWLSDVLDTIMEIVTSSLIYCMEGAIGSTTKSELEII